ncbi:hypothetical protein CIB95_02595 [Lottiidibacillus patelloidae]|uniref:DUF4131 domain-containing protein n=1 Tax=Lottiidibacillus patelloidae TaxID=2670334 RepID=A0A263BXM5_9BACI|nr:hypothetical protein [Lottiidibacillus patelloidae]OZM58475.1 hypothetical protein CIB95_02595 [Lottiidibacillus patelloidae]
MSNIVTAIVIPIIILYFYYLSRREIKKKLESWLNVGTVSEDVQLEGTISTIFTELEQFYHGKYVWSCELKVKTSDSVVKVKMKKPYVDNFTSPSLEKGRPVICNGIWKDGVFLANKIELKARASTVEGEVF